MNPSGPPAPGALSTPKAVYFLRLCCLFEAGYYLFGLLRSLERNGISAISFDSLYFVSGLSAVFLLPLLVVYCSFKPSPTARSYTIGLLAAALAVRLWFSSGLFRYVLIDMGLVENMFHNDWSALSDQFPILQAAFRYILRISVNLFLLLLLCRSGPVKAWFDAYGGKAQA